MVKLTLVAKAAVLAMCLAGCTTTAPLESYSPKPVIPTDAMIALSPGAGAILGIVQTGYVNAVEQKVSLDTRTRGPGENYITIQMFEAVARSSTPGGLQDVPLSNLDLAGEARGTVNFADMKLSPYYVQNQYGPFGYSMGRTATADICMYAWQRIAPDLKPSGGVARGAINMRALICDQAKTEQELLDIMFQLRIKGVTGVATRAPTDIGAYGTIITPFAAAGPANVLAPVTPAARPQASTPRPKPQPAPQDDPAGPVTPPPGTSAPTDDEDVPVVPLPTTQEMDSSRPPILATTS